MLKYKIPQIVTLILFLLVTICVINVSYIKEKGAKFIT